MSRTNKGGARLRAITLFAGATAIAAGVFAATRHHPLVESCSITETALQGSKTFEVACSGLNAFGTTYRLNTNGDSDLSAADLGTGDGTSRTNARGLAGAGSGPLQISGVSNPTRYFNTSSSDSTDSATNVKLQKLQGGNWVDVVDSDSMKVYYLSYTNTDTTVIGGDPARLKISGLLSGDSVVVNPLDASSGNPDISGYATSGTFHFDSMSPYNLSLTDSDDGATDSVIDVNISTVNPASNEQAVYQIKMGGEVIGQGPTVTVQNH